MARRRSAPKREVLVDPKFGSELLTKFINHVMDRGKKSIAEKIVYGALDHAVSKLDNKMNEILKKEDSTEPTAVVVFRKILNSLSPTVEVRARRVGGATYQVPMEVRPVRRVALAMRWLMEAAKARKEKTMSLRLSNEILDVLMGRGTALKKREDMHRMAIANQAFAHYRWWVSKEGAEES